MRFYQMPLPHLHLSLFKSHLKAASAAGLWVFDLTPNPFPPSASDRPFCQFYKSPLRAGFMTTSRIPFRGARSSHFLIKKKSLPNIIVSKTMITDSQLSFTILSNRKIIIFLQLMVYFIVGTHSGHVMKFPQNQVAAFAERELGIKTVKRLLWRLESQEDVSECLPRQIGNSRAKKGHL